MDNKFYKKNLDRIKESKEYTPDISQEQKRDDIAKGKLSVKEYEDPFKK